MPRIILGIDPGSTIMGYGVIEMNENSIHLIDMGVLNLSKVSDGFEKLKKIFDFTVDIIKKYKPTELSIESQFFGKNVQSMLKLGRAQGVAISAALSMDLAIYEYAPRKIKMSITGLGTASKEQMALSLQRLFKFGEIPEKLDATDGLAAAVCHSYQRKPSVEGKTFSGWAAYANANKAKVRK